jgi:hypothetical protein
MGIAALAACNTLMTFTVVVLARVYVPMSQHPSALPPVSGMCAECGGPWRDPPDRYSRLVGLSTSPGWWTIAFAVSAVLTLVRERG